MLSFHWLLYTMMFPCSKKWIKLLLTSKSQSGSSTKSVPQWYRLIKRPYKNLLHKLQQSQVPRHTLDLIFLFDKRDFFSILLTHLKIIDIFQNNMFLVLFFSLWIVSFWLVKYTTHLHSFLSYFFYFINSTVHPCEQSNPI